MDSVTVKDKTENAVEKDENKSTSVVSRSGIKSARL
jgi:hypothetical protein